MIEITPEYLDGQGLNPTFLSRFWAKVHKTDGCWLWTASVSNGWCGQIQARRENGRSVMIRAPRASWILHIGPIPEGMEVCHDCPNGDNPRCIRPEHLWLGTQADNVADAVSKGRTRGTWRRAEDHNMAVLTWEQIDEIRSLYDPTKRNGAQLARAFGIGASQLCRIVHNQSWKK